jgi:hypothetical protein
MKIDVTILLKIKADHLNIKYTVLKRISVRNSKLQ